MSRRIWRSSEDERRFQVIDGLFLNVLQVATHHLILQQNISDSDNDESYGNNNENPFLASLPAIAEIADLQHQRINIILEDPNIFVGLSKTIQDFSEYDCQLYFRFLKQDLIEISSLLWPRLSPFLGSDDPERIEVGGKYVAHYETCLCLYLFKMSHPCRLCGDTEKFFGIRKSKLSRMVIFFGGALYCLAVQYLSDLQMWKHKFAQYGDVVSQKCGGIFPNIWGFIDGTIRRTCRPIRYQDMMYTRYKRCHGLKFQSIITPDGFIANLSGPYVARFHDARMLRESGVMDQLLNMMPRDGNEPISALFGDLAYPQSEYLFGGFVNPPPNSPERRFNTEMSRVRIVVEWGFANVLRRWQHLDFQRSAKVLLQPMGQQFVNCVFLSNVANCYYGGAINKYFDCDIMSIHQYLALIDNDDEIN